MLAYLRGLAVDSHVVDVVLASGAMLIFRNDRVSHRGRRCWVAAHGLSIPADRLLGMISMNSRNIHSRTIEPTTGTGRNTETRTGASAAPIRVIPLWKAPCALAPQVPAKR
ncbi:hypothetical protein [Kitasatospora indigofera]|uniref:hypothetical protein n=1 Tax=Kitasatospora indigofera TaxID=67307 RepID=UPI0033A05891